MTRPKACKRLAAGGFPGGGLWPRTPEKFQKFCYKINEILCEFTMFTLIFKNFCEIISIYF